MEFFFQNNFYFYKINSLFGLLLLYMFGTGFCGAEGKYIFIYSIVFAVILIKRPHI